VTHLGSVEVTDGGEWPGSAPAMTVPAWSRTTSAVTRELAEAGVRLAIVRFPDSAAGTIERFAPVIDAFR
jgi:hypothetical protein